MWLFRKYRRVNRKSWWWRKWYVRRGEAGGRHIKEKGGDVNVAPGEVHLDFGIWVWR
jgi:hypothetical protein